jgi:hypothetical protein
MNPVYLGLWLVTGLWVLFVGFICNSAVCNLVLALATAAFGWVLYGNHCSKSRTEPKYSDSVLPALFAQAEPYTEPL